VLASAAMQTSSAGGKDVDGIKANACTASSRHHACRKSRRIGSSRSGHSDATGSTEPLREPNLRELQGGASL
jgi:hypothetical protein